MSKASSFHPDTKSAPGRTKYSNHILQLELLVLRTFKVTDPIALTKSARRGPTLLGCQAVVLATTTVS